MPDQSGKRQFTDEQLSKLHLCEHRTHQVDENVPGLNAGGTNATTCPDDPRFNARFAMEQSGRDAAMITAAILEDLLVNGPIAALIQQDVRAHGPIGRVLRDRFL